MDPRGPLFVLLLVVGCSARPQEEVATSASDETAADTVVTDTTIVNDFVVGRVVDDVSEKLLELEPVPQTTAKTQASEPAPLTTAKSSEPSPLTTATFSEPSPLTTAKSSEPSPSTTAKPLEPAPLTTAIPLTTGQSEPVPLATAISDAPPSESSPSTLTEDDTNPDPSTNIIQEEALPISLKMTIMPEQNLRFRPGRVFSLECDATADAHGGIEFAWTKDGVFIKPGGHIIRESRNNGNILLLQPEPNDAGVYRCWASNSEGSVRSHAVMVRMVGQFVPGKPVPISEPEVGREPKVFVVKPVQVQSDDGVMIVEAEAE